MIATMRAIQIVTRSFCETCLLLVIVMSDLTNGDVSGPLDTFSDFEELSTTTTTTFPPYTHPQWIEPYFDPTTPRNVTALMGKSAYLSCRVRNLGNKTVSWIRHRDIHILTVGSYTYTSDLRFQATHHHDSDDWTLQIKWTQKRDAGMYECQISTQPVRSYFVNLNVVVPTATILGGPDLHVDKGSTINLTCTVKFSPEPPAYIFWYHHEEVINYDSSRGGVSVITEKGDVTTSFLLIQNADLADSGKYSCAPSNADVASVRVHVLNGEHPEAMQTGSSGCQYSWLTILLLMTMVFYYNQQYIRGNLTNCLLKTSTNTANTCLTCNRSQHTTSSSKSSSKSSSLSSSSSSCFETTTIKTASSRCICRKNKSFKTYNKTTVTTNKSNNTDIRSITININTFTTKSQPQRLHCPDCHTNLQQHHHHHHEHNHNHHNHHHHLLANNTNFDNNCCNHCSNSISITQKLVSTS